jgi:hypothetical protein
MKQQLDLLKNENEDLRSANSALQTKFETFNQETENCRQAFARQAELIELNEADHKRECANLKTEYEQAIADKDSELAEIKLEMANSRSLFDEQKRALRREGKVTERKLRTDLDSQIERTEELRNHYERLLTDIRGRLSESRKLESQAQLEKQKNDALVKELRSDLSAARIDSNMFELKLRATQERVERDQKMLESKHRVEMMQLDAAHQKILQEHEQQFAEKQHQFFLSICERFKEFVDFSAQISSDSVQQLLDDVVKTIRQFRKRERDFNQSRDELADIRSIVGADRSTPVRRKLVALAKDARAYQEAKNAIEQERKEVAELARQARAEAASDITSREWEQWAKRLHSLVTDNFSRLKTQKDLQMGLEEALMQRLGERHVKRRLEILRMEKAILASGIVNLPPPAHRQPSLWPLVCMAVTIRRLRKLAGHLQSPHLSPAREPGRERSAAPKRYPVMNVE